MDKSQISALICAVLAVAGVVANVAGALLENIGLRILGVLLVILVLILAVVLKRFWVGKSQ